jgi:hypothetical protein
MQLTRNEKEIINYIRHYTQRYFRRKGTSNWTRIIKKALEILGRNLGYRIYPSHGRGEWLYDLCWSKERKGKGGWRDFRGLKLITEIEWKKGKDGEHSYSILEDFQKLTVGIADCRLMVIGYNEKGRKYNDAWLNKIIEKCRIACCNSGKKFRYLIIALPEQRKENIRKHLIAKGKTYII